MKIRPLLCTLAALAVPAATARAEAILLNFSILGEVNRFHNEGYCLAYFGIGSHAGGGSDYQFNSGSISIGGITNAVWQGSEMFSGLVAPATGWWVLDRSFAVPLDLPLGSSHLTMHFMAKGQRVVFDFSSAVSFHQSFPGNPLQADPREQGLTLHSITLADGRPLSAENLTAVFIQPETYLYTTAMESGARDQDSTDFTAGATVASKYGLAHARARTAATSAAPLLRFDISPDLFLPYADDVEAVVRNRSGSGGEEAAKNFAIYRIRNLPTALKLTQVSPTGNGKAVTLEWNSNAGEGFAVQRSFDLVNWSMAKNFVAGTAGTTTFIDSLTGSDAAAPRCYYRLIINPWIIP